MNRCIEESNTKGKEYLQYPYAERARPWFYKLKLLRKRIVWLNRARSNHTSTPESLDKMNLISSSECKSGHFLGDIEQIMSTTLKKLPNNVPRAHQKQFFPPILYTRSFLHNLNITNIKIIDYFMNKCQLIM